MSPIVLDGILVLNDMRFIPITIAQFPKAGVPNNVLRFSYTARYTVAVPRL